MHNYYFKIEVTGRGKFPLDQLRRFEMFPIDTDTACRIEDSFGPDKALSKTYTLGMYASSLAADSPCAARFASFGFNASTLEVWKNDELFYANGEVVQCGHVMCPGPTAQCTFDLVKASCTNPSQGSHGAGYDIREDSIGEEHPYCRKCGEELEL